MYPKNPVKQRNESVHIFWEPVTRRTFLKKSTAGLLSIVAVGRGSIIFAYPDGTKLALAKGVIVADRSLCSGCRICEAVCCSRNMSEGRNSGALSRIILEKNYLSGDYGQNVCFQCSQPLCLDTCPTDPRALHVDQKSGTYARDIDPDLCIGCEQCIEACEEVFNLPRPRYDPEYDVCIKCHLCHGDPQCVRFCPYGALHYKTSESGLKTGYPYIQGK